MGTTRCVCRARVEDRGTGGPGILMSSSLHWCGMRASLHYRLRHAEPWRPARHPARADVGGRTLRGHGTFPRQRAVRSFRADAPDRGVDRLQHCRRMWKGWSTRAHSIPSRRPRLGKRARIPARALGRSRPALRIGGSPPPAENPRPQAHARGTHQVFAPAERSRSPDSVGSAPVLRSSGPPISDAPRDTASRARTGAASSPALRRCNATGSDSPSS
jgi:hypothetical protein